jgi:hypothetical protein
MIAFRVTINGNPPVVGGANDLSVLTAIVTASGLLGKDTFPARPNEDDNTSVEFRLGGLTRRAAGAVNEHLVWLDNLSLNPGDRVTVDVIETESVDPVETSCEAGGSEGDERQLFEFAKRNYFALRNKYESGG